MVQTYFHYSPRSVQLHVVTASEYVRLSVMPTARKTSREGHAILKLNLTRKTFVTWLTVLMVRIITYYSFGLDDTSKSKNIEIIGEQK